MCVVSVADDDGGIGSGGSGGGVLFALRCAFHIHLLYLSFYLLFLKFLIKFIVSQMCSIFVFLPYRTCVHFSLQVFSHAWPPACQLLLAAAFSLHPYPFHFDPFHFHCCYE